MRIQVNLSDEIVSQIDAYAKSIGVPRSSLLSVWIGQIVQGTNMVMQASEERMKEVLENEIK